MSVLNQSRQRDWRTSNTCLRNDTTSPTVTHAGSSQGRRRGMIAIVLSSILNLSTRGTVWFSRSWRRTCVDSSHSISSSSSLLLPNCFAAIGRWSRARITSMTVAFCQVKRHSASLSSSDNARTRTATWGFLTSYLCQSSNSLGCRLGCSFHDGRHPGRYLGRSQYPRPSSTWKWSRHHISSRASSPRVSASGTSNSATD